MEGENQLFFADEALVTLTEKRASLFCGEIKARKCGEEGDTRLSLFGHLAGTKIPFRELQHFVFPESELAATFSVAYRAALKGSSQVV